MTLNTCRRPMGSFRGTAVITIRRRPTDGVVSRHSRHNGRLRRLPVLARSFSARLTASSFEYG